ncbi:malonyl CoA-ACP transacylase [Virgibacillus soli]|uniref:ACP S-malonyltransferase n=1 Tax=Lederbergia galactosidilytica TaxID=217031 RepID=UPI0007162B39|nr:ACP S-malonyltransferase [Lederbergia galactosidilytica]KRG13507.1 malonyl CoA-ACP transacylase [Virgibacillus soli]MBP1913689.1 [acyl-carrier-protein] S-malonyltransferase [Lederbergia galactosidilytica]
MGKIAFVFPGQGSQTVGMGASVREKEQSAKEIFDLADKRLGRDLTSIILNGPQEELTKTANAQPALLTTSIALLQGLSEAGIQPDYTAGHSLGEYTALVASGAISFSDAVYAVAKRGELMEEAVPNGEGTMAAVLGMDRTLLSDICQQVADNGKPVQLANMNCPGQIVISGSVAGVTEAGEIAKKGGAKRVLPLQVSGPFHSVLMKPAAESFTAVLDEIHIREAHIPLIANVTAKPISDRLEIQKLLLEQLYSPVLWEDSVRQMIELGVDTFVEIGPGKVLTGLIRKINRDVTALSVQDSESCQAAVTALRGNEG